MKLGPFFVGIWLILTGLRGLINLQFQYDALVMAGLAVVAGILTLIRQ